MPIYEYNCNGCGHHFEEIQKVSDPHIMSCPKCGQGAARQISQTSFSLRGEGWYKDGYAKPPPKKETSASAAAPDKPAAPTPPTAPAVKPSTNKGD